MTTTASLRIALLAALLAVIAPLPAPADPEDDKESVPAGDRATGFAPRAGNRVEVLRAGKGTSIEAPRGVQPYADGYVTLQEKSVLLRKAEERAIIVYPLEHEATAWWSIPNGAGILYVFEGKLRFKSADSAMKEKELGEAPVGAPSVGGMNRNVAWVAGGQAYVADLEGAAPRKIAPPADREFAELALSRNGTRLFATVKPKGGDGVNEVVSLTLAGEAKWETRLALKDGTIACLSATIDDWSVLFTQTVTTGTKVRTSVNYLAKGAAEAATLVWAEGVTEVFPSTDGQAAWFSSKGANGRRKIFRAELNLRPNVNEHICECIVQADDADCAGLTRGAFSGTAYYVEKRDGAADRVGILTGF